MAYTERYVTTTGSSGNTGTNDTTDAWDLATGINNTGAAIRLNIKTGSYATNNLNFTSAGTATTSQPCHIRGYSSTPGDVDLGRSTSDYKLVTTNMPTIAFNSGQNLNINKPFITFEGIRFTGNTNNQLIGVTTAPTVFYNCVINNVNGSNNSNAYGIYANCACISCDIITGGSAHYGGVYAESNATYIGCYFLGTGLSTSVGLAYNNNITAINNVFSSYGTGVQRNYTGTNYTREIVMNNTFYAMVNECYEDLNSGSSSVTHTVLLNNHATDSGKFVNNTSTNNVLLISNRTRDNTNANSNMGESLNIGAVTTDNGGPDTDYRDYSSGLFQLRPTAVGRAAGFIDNADIGALQSPSSSNSVFLG